MKTSPPERYKARPVVERDLDDVVCMIDEADQALDVPPDSLREFLTWLWHLPTTDLERDTRIALDGDTIVAFGQGTWRPDEGGPLHVLIRVHPEHQGVGLGTWLLSWGEALAHERGSEGLRMDVVDLDEPGHNLLRSWGYRQVRSSFTMWKGLEADESPGFVPAGVKIRRYEDADERVLFEVNQGSFADHWGFRPTSFETFNEAMHGQGWDPSLVFLAEVDEVPVGHVVAFLFEKKGHIASLGVLKPWRGRGFAKALLMRAFAEIASRGMGEVRLEVDAQNPHGAVALYKGVGMAALRRYDIFDLGTTETGGRGSQIGEPGHQADGSRRGGGP